jgi:NitT/TauT family transport system permease protein
MSRRLLPALTLALLVLAWEAAVQLFAVPSFILPPPSAVIVTMISESELLLTNALTTMLEAGLGLVLGTVVGLALAMLMTLVPALRGALYPLVIGTQTTPKVAIAPLLILWFGADLLPKVLIVALLAFFPVLINSLAGLESSSAAHLELLRSVNASQWQMYRHIRVPAAIPFIFAGLKLALTSSVIGAVVAEWVASDRGLGFLLIRYNAAFRTTDLFAALFTIVAVASLSFLLLDLAERWLSWEARIHANRAAVVVREASL